MSFALPTTITIVNKYPNLSISSIPKGFEEERLWDIVAKYEPFRELVRIAQMEDLLKDPQTRATVFVPLDLHLSTIILKSCLNSSKESVEERRILDITPEAARTMVNSVIIPNLLTTTMMIQSAFTRYRTRDLVNTLITTTPHCVQFESDIYNRPPFGLVLNNRSRILTPDIRASNGIVHTTDTFPYIL
jgi:hypothetical protein